MKEFYPIIILTCKKIVLLNSDYLIIHSPIELLDNYHIKYNEQIISFDYLIFDNICLITNYLNSNILHENTMPITNFFHATSIENIFYSEDIFDTIDIIKYEEF